jgi:diguanylate cyclase (GGDEF)-like protein
MGKANLRPAFYDELTGLPKFNLLRNVLTDYIVRRSCNQFAGVDRFALVYLDINNFTYLNETYGYKVCDNIIKCLAEYLATKVNNPNYVTRVTSDKFAILCTDIESDQQIYDTIDEILSDGCNICISDYVFYITMSAGIALFPEHGRDIDTLMRKAETASYLAKKSGKDINLYSDELQKDMIEQVQMINKLQNGIEKEEFTLFYQPEYNLITNEIIGVEALVRWPHPENGFIPPDIFIPIAERSRQIYSLERWIINAALHQKQQWEENGLEKIELSINLSSKTLESESNFQKIEEIISSYQVDFTKIIFEITETIILTQVDLAIERLNRLRAYGIKIALDDFGTGYSSLTHIMKLPIDIIKIDKSFIQSIPHGNEETVITHNILSLAHELNYRVVAEGIETQEQLDYLKLTSCERGQGYLLCKPLPGDKLNEVLLQ